MKHFLFLLLITMFVSCRPMERADYKYKIVYTIDGVAFERTDNLLDVPANTIPTYMLKKGFGKHTNNQLIVTAIYEEEYIYPFSIETIYEGNLSCNVVSFDYCKIRNFKASKWNGKEIKPK